MLGYERVTTVKAVRKSTTRDLEWAAGFLEGEGCISKSHQTGRKGAEHVSAAQVNPEPLWRLQEIFGGQIGRRKANTPGGRVYWVWQIAGSRARGVMMTLYSLLSTTKQAQVQEALRDTV